MPCKIFPKAGGLTSTSCCIFFFSADKKKQVSGRNLFSVPTLMDPNFQKEIETILILPNMCMCPFVSDCLRFLIQEQLVNFVRS